MIQDTGTTSVKIYIFSKKSKFVLKTKTDKPLFKLQLFVERVIGSSVPIFVLLWTLADLRYCRKPLDKTGPATGGVLWKNLLFKISQYSQENACVEVSF